MTETTQETDHHADQQTPTLLQRVEHELGVSLSSSAEGEDSELERRTDMRRILRTRDQSLDHVGRIEEKCGRLTSIVMDMEQVQKETERLTHTVTTRNPFEIAGAYVWSRVTGRKPKSLDDYLLIQAGNVRRFNVDLGKLISAWRTQLDASTREYSEFTEAREIVEARQRQYQPVLEEMQKLYDTFDRHVQNLEHGNPGLPRQDAARRLLSIKVGELQHAMRKYATQRDGVEETIETHTMIDDRLREHLHLWEDLYAFSVPYERRVVQMRLMMPQMLAQQDLTKAMRSAIVLFAGYLEGLRSRIEGKMLDLGREMTPLQLGYGGMTSNARRLLGE